MIVVRDLVFEYPAKRALHGVSLSIAPGSITALVGPNGAGKTTLLRCLAALERPYSGDVFIDGIDTRDDPRAIHERLGYLADFYGLYDELSVERCLVFAARARGLARPDALRAAQAAAAHMQLSERLGSKAGELSRGLRQRLAIAQAIVHAPKVLLFDEPAAGLDPQARRDLSQLLLGLKAGGMTLIVSSHILSELADYSTDMLVMNAGRIAGGGPIKVGAGTGDRIRIALASSRADFPTFLRRHPGVVVHGAGPGEASITLAGGDFAKALLLRALIETGFAVAEFAETGPGLEDAYFAKVGQAAE